jgi:hypothetical protein
MRNDGKTAVNVTVEKKPRYVTTNADIININPGEEASVGISFLTDEYGKMGHAAAMLTFDVDAAGKKHKGLIGVEANVVDDFSKMTPEMRKKAPAAVYSADRIDFGRLPDAGKAEYLYTITNNGETTLQVYSVSCPDERVKISGGKKKIRPGASATYKLRINPKKTEGSIATTVTVVSNAPASPVKVIKITADK